MRSLFLKNHLDQVKINDTNSDIILQAYDDKHAHFIDSDVVARVKIKNESGFLLTIDCTVTNGYDASFKTSALSKLPVGDYELELWLAKADGNVIYPNENFVNFRINENTTMENGSAVSTITMDYFEEQFNSLKTDPDLKGPKGDTGKTGDEGKAGADGRTTHFHVAYAESSDGVTGFSVTESLNKPYIGQYTDYTQAGSTDPTKYMWTLIKGETGGADSIVTIDDDDWNAITDG